MKQGEFIFNIAKSERKDKVNQANTKRGIKREKFIKKNKNKGRRTKQKFKTNNKSIGQEINKVSVIKNKDQTIHKQKQIKQLPSFLTTHQNNKNQIIHQTTTSFEQLKLQSSLFNSLKQNKYYNPTKIQYSSFQIINERKNCIIKAQTGSGKTLAYLIPLINELLSWKQQKNIKITRGDGIYFIIVCPTRQLCLQGQQQASKCLKRNNYIIGGSIIGGQQIHRQKAKLRKGLNILFGTPGRIQYHLKNTQCFKLDKVRAIVFEQADRTLDMGFKKQVNEVLGIFRQKGLILRQIQKILVSAQFNQKIQDLIQNIQLVDAQKIGFQINDSKKQITKQLNVPDRIRQTYSVITQQQKVPFLLAYLKLGVKAKAIVFVATCDQVQLLVMLLQNLYMRDCNGLFLEERVQQRVIYKLHGNIDQRQRTQTYLSFKNQKVKLYNQRAIIISTDVASRGLDFPDVTHIILFDIPATVTDYANRVGRTARYDKSGVSMLLVHYQQTQYIQQLKIYGSNIQLIQKQTIFKYFQKQLRNINIGQHPLQYLLGLIRDYVSGNQDKYMKARRSYVSMLRAYARLDKQIFNVKKLNLKYLARSFGLNSVKSRRIQTIREGYLNKGQKRMSQKQQQVNRKVRKITSVKELQKFEFV